MYTNRSIKTKAFFLLLLLVFQTLAGFACAIDHLPLHAVSHRHTQHIPASGIAAAHKHHNNDTRAHCCTERSAHLVKADKLSSPEQFRLQLPVLFLLHAPAPYTIAFLDAALLTVQPVYIPDEGHPPISDIRIAMQRFQI